MLAPPGRRPRPSNAMATDVQGPPAVFISYSREDRVWLSRLLVFLKPGQRAGKFSVWVDQRIAPGDRWDEEIKAALDTAQVAVLLVSADFLASDYIMKCELPAILAARKARGLIVLYVLIGHCGHEGTGLAEIQSVSPQLRPVIEMDQAEQDRLWKSLASLVEEKADRIQAGRDAAGERASAPRVYLERLTRPEERLIGREDKVTVLNASWSAQDANILTLVGWGGLGKTTLVTSWLESLRREGYPGAEWVIGWSFDRGAGKAAVALADEFMNLALRWFDDPKPEAGPPWDRGERLARFMRQHRTLLILDGLDAIQWPDGHGRGRVRNVAVATLLGKLARGNRGLCVITTRMPVAGIPRHVGNRIEKLGLDRITPEAGAELIRAKGYLGPEAQREQYAAEFGCHTLALQLLAGYLRTAPDHSDPDAGPPLPPKLAGDNVDAPVERVLVGFEQRYGDGAKLELLRILGLAGGPVTYKEVVALQNRAIPGLSEHLAARPWYELIALVGELTEARLVAQDRRQTDMIEAHPLVRDFFGARLRDERRESWREGHLALFDCYSDMAKDLPQGNEEVFTLCRAVIHGCEAGQHQKAFEKFWEGVVRDYSFFIQHNAEVGEVLPSVLRLFVPIPWRGVDRRVDPRWRRRVLICAGMTLRGVGRFPEALQALAAASRLGTPDVDPKDAAFAIGYQSRLLATMGNVSLAVRHGRRCLAVAVKIGKPEVEKAASNVLATALHHFGQFAAAERHYREGLSISEGGQHDLKLTLFVQYYQYLDLLLDLDQEETVIRAVESALREEDIQGAGPLVKALLDLVLGQARFARLQKGLGEQHEAVEKMLEDAVRGLQESWIADYVPRGLLARARFRLHAGSLDDAKSDVKAAYTLSRRVGMDVHEADCHLVSAQIFLAEDKTTEARRALDWACNLVLRCGYYRRDRLIRDLERKVALRKRR